MADNGPDAAAAASKKTFHGSCHCGKIKYEINYAVPSPPKAGRCNCTICLKSGYTGITLADEADFKLLAPSSEAQVPDYQWRSKQVHRRFCDKCGVQVYGKGEYEFNGHKIKFFNVNALTLDQPQEGLELSDFKISYCSGRDDTFAIQDKPFVGGIA